MPDESLMAGEPLAALPIFFKLRGRPVLLAGSGAGMSWKAELLVSCGAALRVLSPTPPAALAALAARRDDITLEARAWRSEDLAGAALAILDAEDLAEVGLFREAARAAGVPVNVVDKTEFCDFAFGAIVNRSPLVVAISTDGAAPVFGQAIRARIEALLPASLTLWAKAARDWREKLSSLRLDFRQRRGFWERFAELALRAGAQGPDDADFAALAAAKQASLAPSQGHVILVGAGPGDPDLLTLKAVRALQSADFVLYDRVADPRMLELARREAVRIDVGKRAGQVSPGQAEITDQLITLARAGKTVVRLKGGDPSIFGRASEEIAAAKAAGVKITIVPGVTSALAAAAELELSLTDRDLAPRLQFVTARDGVGETPERLSWPALVSSDATTVVYMGARKLEALVARLIAEGLDPSTPAVYRENVSLEGATGASAPIADLPAAVASRALVGRAVLIYGRALAAEGTR